MPLLKECNCVLARLEDSYQVFGLGVGVSKNEHKTFLTVHVREVSCEE